jgi:hypothetical protein
LKTLLDRGAVVPSAVIGRTPLWENAWSFERSYLQESFDHVR